MAAKGPRRVQGGRGQAAQASGGHPGWEGDPLGSPGSFVTVEVPGGWLGHPSGGKGEWPPGPGIPGWGERVQCPDLGLHNDAPPSGSPGGCQLGPGGQPRGSCSGPGGPVEGAPVEVLCDRRQLEDAHVAIHGTPKPRLEFQGSDGYLKKQWRLIAKGELGYIPAKHIVSALPEEGERPSSTHKKITVDGWDREDEEEVRSHPTSRRQLERLHQTFRTTLLAALPQFGNLKVTKAELDDWYDWFYGEDIAGRRPPPSDTTLLFAERNAWRKIHEMVHQGTTLSDALKNIRGDFLFWQREVYEHLNRAPEKGKNKGKAQTQWEKPKKGGKGAWPSGPTRSKPKGKGGKGKSPNSPSVPWPDHWAFKNPKGVAYCRDHHLHNKCSGSCGRSHNCPVRKDGWVCDAPPSKHAPGMPSPSQVTGGHSGCHRPRGFPVSVGITGHQCESAHRGGEPSPPEGRQSGGGQDGLRWGGTSRVPSEEEERSQPGHPEGRKHPFPPHR